MFKDLSIGMLSYRSPITLSNTLGSYKDNGLLELCPKFNIFFQAITSRDIDIANIYGIKCLGWPVNMKPFDWRLKQIADTFSTRYMLILENDWNLIENRGETERQLTEAMELLSSKKADVVRLRHRKNPGRPLYSQMQWGGKETEKWDKARTHLMECVHWYDNPDERFPDYIKKDGDYYYTDSHSVNFTNNPCIYETETFKEKISPFFLENQNIELRIEKEYWPNLNMKVYHGKGLFSHNRLDR